MEPQLAKVALGRRDLVNQLYVGTRDAAKMAAYTHTHDLDLPALLKVAIAVQDDHTLEHHDETENFDVWLRRSPRVGTTAMADRLLREPHLVTAISRPSALKTAIANMSDEDLRTFTDVSIAGTGEFSVRLVADTSTRTVSRLLEKKSHGVIFSTFSVNLPLTDEATRYYNRICDWSIQTADGLFIPRQVKSLESFPRQKFAMAAVEALQEVTSIYTGDNDDLLKSIRLQDMITIPGPEGTGQSDPFELFTEDERLDATAARLTRDNVLDETMVDLRLPEHHWTGVANSHDLYCIARAFETGSKIFSAELQLQIEGEGKCRNLVRYLHIIYQDLEPRFPDDVTWRISQRVLLSTPLVDRLYDAAVAHTRRESENI